MSGPKTRAASLENVPSTSRRQGGSASVSSLTPSRQAWGLAEMGTVGLWALTPPCGLRPPGPGHGSVTRWRPCSGPPVSGLQGQLGPQLLAPHRVWPRVSGSLVPSSHPHPAALPWGWPGGVRGCRPFRGTAGWAEPAARWGPRCPQATPCSPEERSYFLRLPRVCGPSSVQEVGRSIKGVFQFAFFPPFFSFSLLAGSRHQVTVSKGPACVPRAAHRSWGEAQRLEPLRGAPLHRAMTVGRPGARWVRADRSPGAGR